MPERGERSGQGSQGKPRRRPAPGRYAYEGLDRLLHEKARLGIMTSLLAHPEGLLFNDLKEVCSLTDGNLSRHIHVLHEAGLVEVQKGFERNRPQTLCRLTSEGGKRFLDYVEILQKVIHDAQPSSSNLRTERPPGWAPA